MPGLLEGQLAKAIYAGFKNKLLTGTLRRVVPGIDLDDNGDPRDSTIQTWTVQGFTDKYSAFYSAQAGIPDSDLKVCIFAQSIPGVTPTKDDKALFQGKWYQLRKVGTDPATALWECQAFEIPVPGEENPDDC